MDFSLATWWWVAAGIAVSAELATGTFYLLMIALGLAAGAVAVHLGFAAPIQLVAAAIVGGGATVAWHAYRGRNGPGALPSAQNRDVNLDIGERVKVSQWASDGTARVDYRGSTWVARLQPGAIAGPGEHLVSAVEGNWLVLTPAAN